MYYNIFLLCNILYTCNAYTSIAFQWYLKKNSKDLDPSVTPNVTALMNALHKPLRKSERKQRAKKTLKSEIKNRNFPPGGLNQLQIPVEEGLQWAKELTTKDFQDERVWRKFSQYLYCSLYTHMCNGMNKL